MAGDNRSEENLPNISASGDQEANLPASVIFMEMMRQAASVQALQNQPLENTGIYGPS